jgi:signal transduction histidine kinase
VRGRWARRFHHHHHHEHHHPHHGLCDWHDDHASFPWDVVVAEWRERRPGWRRRIRDELRLHYGAHLHRRLGHWFFVAICVSAVMTLVAAHFGRAWLAAHPWRVALLFGIPALLLWKAAGGIARRIARPLYDLTRAAQEIGRGNLSARAKLGGGGFDELAAAVSHELRTPLARIRLLVDIARQGGAPGQVQGQGDTGKDAKLDANTLDEIEREAIEIDTLVGELLASARLEFQALTPKPLEAGEVARRALERAGEDPGKLIVEPASIAFVADPTLMARALANLIDNARKHGGGLDAVGVYAGDGVVRFAVSDRGGGFAPGEEARVFDRFTRGGNGGGHGALGLGLALVKRIAEAHGGRAEAGNRTGGGARVTLELPLTATV